MFTSVTQTEDRWIEPASFKATLTIPHSEVTLSGPNPFQLATTNCQSPTGDIVRLQRSNTLFKSIRKQTRKSPSMELMEPSLALTPSLKRLQKTENVTPQILKNRRNQKNQGMVATPVQ